ncbi:Glycosyl transferase group 1 [Sphingomonas paucimobilis]|nr:Glycosyl transferase group 1 [Sphingomonas paucimobilis]
MRICSIITSFTSGGAEMLVRDLAERFAATGHDATVIALSDAAQIGNDRETETAMMAHIREAGGQALSLGLANRNAWIRGARALRGLACAINPDVIHCHTARALPIVALARPRVPVVLTHHNSRLSFPPAAFHLFNRIADGYVAISEQCETMLRAHSRKPVQLIWNAANPRFRASKPRQPVAHDPMILAVGTVSEQKDYPTLIRAARLLAAALAPQGRRPCICIAGGGPMLGELQALVEASGAGSHVELLGARGDVDMLMRRADLFVNSSLWEGFPISLIEAASSGLPMVATHVAGNREMVVPGMNGELVPPGDAQALASAMAAMLSDDASHARLSAGALESAGRFSIERCAAAHLALYGRLRENRSGHRAYGRLSIDRECA